MWCGTLAYNTAPFAAFPPMNQFEYDRLQASVCPPETPTGALASPDFPGMGQPPSMFHCHFGPSPFEPRASTSHHSYSKALCAVCGDLAEGLHFGAVTCAACGAFFRRSVTDQKVYTCDTRSCSIQTGNTRRGGICRYCRFKKCIQAGMLPQVVQTRRQKYSSESAADNYKTMFNGECSTPNLEALVQMRREFASRRTSFFASQERKNTVLEQFEEFSFEWDLFLNGLLAHPLMNQIKKPFEDVPLLQTKVESQMGAWSGIHEAPRALRDLFFVSHVVELVLTTIRSGGVQLDSCITTTGLQIDVNDSSLMRYFSTLPSIRNPQCMARLCSPLFTQLVRNCARSLQALHLDECETAFLAYMALADTSVEDRLRESLFSELLAHYGCPIEFSTKMGSLLLALNSLKDAVAMFRDYITLFDLEVRM